MKIKELKLVCFFFLIVLMEWWYNIGLKKLYIFISVYRKVFIFGFMLEDRRFFMWFGFMSVV